MSISLLCQVTYELQENCLNSLSVSEEPDRDEVIFMHKSIKIWVELYIPEIFKCGLRTRDFYVWSAFFIMRGNQRILRKIKQKYTFDYNPMQYFFEELGQLRKVSKDEFEQRFFDVKQASMTAVQRETYLRSHPNVRFTAPGGQAP